MKPRINTAKLVVESTNARPITRIDHTKSIYDAIGDQVRATFGKKPDEAGASVRIDITEKTRPERDIIRHGISGRFRHDAKLKVQFSVTQTSEKVYLWAWAVERTDTTKAIDRRKAKGAA